ncbi:hypothetical protein [Luteirhabdus pelagi]|uniref:hypothetical protein n=1 Tax=Luteirhabdus pelagi TaxID=2792783 RepID=UPI00193A6DCB|nr:hypothetical protein [Luteirhabdus pelagi]
MGLKEIYQWDRRMAEKLRRFQLPQSYQTVGLAIAIIAFVGLIARKFMTTEPDWIRSLCLNLILVGLLTISLSKEKVEDEYIAMLRSRSYQFAFIMGVLYVLIQPYVTYAVEYLFNPEEAEVQMSYFQAIAFMLMVQLLFFKVFLKKCS